MAKQKRPVESGDVNELPAPPKRTSPPILPPPLSGPAYPGHLIGTDDGIPAVSVHEATISFVIPPPRPRAPAPLLAPISAFPDSNSTLAHQVRSERNVPSYAAWLSSFHRPGITRDHTFASYILREVRMADTGLARS